MTNLINHIPDTAVDFIGRGDCPLRTRNDILTALNGPMIVEFEVAHYGPIYLTNGNASYRCIL